MQLNLNNEIEDHFARLRELSDSALNSTEEKMSAKASVMSAMTSLLRELTKTQAEIINMDRLLRVEQAVIETVKEFLNPAQQKEFNLKLKELLKHDIENEESNV